MTDGADHYAALGLPPTASNAEVHAAFRRLQRSLGENTSTDAPSRLAAARRAHAVLTDADLRQRYDRDRAGALRVSLAAPSPPPSPPPPRAAPSPGAARQDQLNAVAADTQPVVAAARSSSQSFTRRLVAGVMEFLRRPWREPRVAWELAVLAAFVLMGLTTLLPWARLPGGAVATPITTRNGAVLLVSCLLAAFLEVWLHRLGQLWILARVVSVWTAVELADLGGTVTTNDPSGRENLALFLGAGSAPLEPTVVPGLAVVLSLLALGVLVGRRIAGRVPRRRRPRA